MTFYDGGSVEDITNEYQVRYTNDGTTSQGHDDYDSKTVSSIPWTVQDYKSSTIGHDKKVSAAVVVEPAADIAIPVDGAAGDAAPPPYKLGYFGIFRVAKTSHTVLNIVGLVAACAAGTAQPLMSIFFGNLTTAFLRYANALTGDPFLLAIAKAELVHQVNNDALALLYLAIGVFVTTYIYMAAWAYTGDKIATRIRVAYLRAILRQEVSYFDNLGDGEIASRGRSGVQTIQNGISEKVPMCLSYVSTFVTAFIVAYLRCWKLALVMTVIIPCIMVTVGILNAVVKKFHMEEHKHLNKGANLAEESFATVRTVQAFGMEKKLLAAYAAINVETLSETLRSSYAHGLGVGSLSFILYSGYALAFYFAAKLIASGETPAGNVTSTIFSLFIGAFSIGNIAPNLQAFSAATASAAKIYETIDRTPIIDSASTEGDRLSSCEGSIQLRNIDFSYASRKGNPVLRDLNLDLEAGKMTALVGASGCGKSTIVSLVERFYDPVEGNVYLDGHDLKSLNLKWLRSQIGYVGQEPTLFAATVRENIEFGLANTELAELADKKRFQLVVAAAKLANAHEFIMKLPNGYDTHVGERGKLLSGGQKQRVAIARAVVKQPKILLLDEATSALDAKSEGVVQEGLDNASVGRTTIVVAHRLCTIVKADRIIVMGPGGVTIESGTHQELVRLKGAYWGLLRTQNNETAEEAKRKTMMLKPPHVVDLEKSLKRLSARNFRISMLSPFGDQAALDELAAIGEREDEEAQHHDDSAKPVKIKPESHSLYYLLTRLFKLSDVPLWKSYVPGVLCAIASGAVYPVYSIVFGMAMTNFARCTGTSNIKEACPEPFNSLMRHRANTIALGFFIIALGATVTATIQTTALQRGGSRLVTRLRYLLFRTFIHADIAFHDEEGHSSGVLASSLSDKAQKVHALVGISMGTIIQSAATVLIGFAVALSYGWKLALVVIACSPLTLGAGLIRLKVVLLKDQKTQKAYEASSRRVTEAAAAIRTIASLTMEEKCLEAYAAGLKEPARVSRDMALYGSALYALSQCISLCVIALGFWFGARQLMLGAYTSGDFYTILLSVVFGSIQAGNVFSFVPDISNAHAATEESLALLDRRDPIGEARGRGLISTGPIRGSVRLHKTHFRYAGRPDVRVLEGLDLEIKAGTSVALVGESGCGKSTTLQLIQRFYDPLAGMVTIDGHDIRSMDLNVLRSQMAVVSQEPSLYDGTIAWNVALGAAVEDPNTVTMEQIRHACQQANILDFIESLEEGFDTQVGGKGVALSGGQKQRIAIARALVRDPKILLLDEATSALDPASEHVVKAALQKASKGRTTITIAHKLSTVMDCDLIYFLKEGKVEESGTHDALIKRNGYYAELSRLQGLSK